MYEDRSPSGAGFGGAGGVTVAGACVCESGAGFFIAMTGGDGVGRGAAFGCGDGIDCFGDGAAGAAGGIIGPGGFSRKVSWTRPLGSSPTDDGGVSFGGDVHNSAMWMQTDSANATQILGITTPSGLLRNTSVRSFINPSLQYCDGVTRTTSKNR